MCFCLSFPQLITVYNAVTIGTPICDVLLKNRYTVSGLLALKVALKKRTVTVYMYKEN